MAEMVIPGTYITVRDEGLIAAGRIAAGVVGIVGTAADGPVGTPVILAGMSDAEERFGAPDDFSQPADGANPLTLVRSLRYIFGNGAATVVAVRCADAGPDAYAAGLDVLATEMVNIVVLAGQDAATMGTSLASHLAATDQTDHERIGVIGATGTTLDQIRTHSLSSDRLILVTPGIAVSPEVTLPAAYTAAAVAGLIAAVDVKTSLTNRPLNVEGLATLFNRGEQEQLIKHNVLTVVRKDGYRILKGITTAGEGTPFAAIPTRRIVDYAKYGVRSAANPYIGRPNNVRVRAALKATLDAFLTRMVEDEAITAYKLEVSATRAQETAGEVQVTMMLQPTFSIDFIRVTMLLQ